MKNIFKPRRVEDREEKETERIERKYNINLKNIDNTKKLQYILNAEMLEIGNKLHDLKKEDLQRYLDLNLDLCFIEEILKKQIMLYLLDKIEESF